MAETWRSRRTSHRVRVYISLSLSSSLQGCVALRLTACLCVWIWRGYDTHERNRKQSSNNCHSGKRYSTILYTFPSSNPSLEIPTVSARLSRPSLSLPPGGTPVTLTEKGDHRRSYLSKREGKKGAKIRREDSFSVWTIGTTTYRLV